MGPQGSIPVSLLQSPHRANCALHGGTCKSHTDFGVLEPHSVPGGCREAPRVFLSLAHKCWLSMAGPYGCTALFDFVPITTEKSSTFHAGNSGPGAGKVEDIASLQLCSHFPQHPSILLCFFPAQITSEKLC